MYASLSPFVGFMYTLWRPVSGELLEGIDHDFSEGV
jgi:hypothetical protein